MGVEEVPSILCISIFISVIFIYIFFNYAENETVCSFKCRPCLSAPVEAVQVTGENSGAPNRSGEEIFRILYSGESPGQCQMFPGKAKCYPGF